MNYSQAARRVLGPAPVDRVLAPFRRFTDTAASGGIVLIVATVVALAWANSPWSDSYNDLWASVLGIRLGDFELEMDLAHWINDGLMVIFFLIVGLEIKREMLAGELASMRQALLPIVAATGGVVAPALIFFAFNAGRPGVDGWGIPVATDIAFVLGVLALLGDRVPIGLKVFLTAFAIVDDIIAVLVIAVFYSDDLAISYFVAAGVIIAALAVANIIQIHHPLIYILLGLGLWYAVFESGIHPTLAGIVLAFTIPARTRVNSRQFVDQARESLDKFESAGLPGSSILTTSEHQAAVAELEVLAEHAQSPIQRLEHTLHPWVAYAIVPIFALANAGVSIRDSGLDALTDPLALGIVFGLVVGKQIGITLFTYLVVRLGFADLPERVGWREVWAVSCLAGIGFTMSLFITNLALGDARLVNSAKIGILSASLIAGSLGYLVLRHVLDRREEAEAS